MLYYSYNRRLAAGVMAAGRALASLIPPSMKLAVYALIVEESVGFLIAFLGIMLFLPKVMINNIAI
jgi:TRAP-type mannitol/chloroaromatic compound transport system permease large subunit